MSSLAPLVPYPAPPLELSKPKDAEQTTNFWREKLSLVLRWLVEQVNNLSLYVDCWCVKTSAQTGFTIDIWTKVTGWTVRRDTHSAFSGDAFTVPKAGVLKVSVNMWGGTPGGGSTDTELLIGIFKDGALITDTVRGFSIRAGLYHTGDAWWVGEAEVGAVYDVRVMFCPAAVGYATTNATVGSYTELDAGPTGPTQLVSFCRFEIMHDFNA